MSGRRSFRPFPLEEAGSAAAAGGGTGAAAGNYATLDASAPNNTGVGPTATIIAAIVLTPQVSGIFRVEAHLVFTDELEAGSENVTLSLFGSEPTAALTPITMSGGTAAAQFGATTLASGTQLGEVSSGTGGITILGGEGGGGPKLLAAKTVHALSADPAELSLEGLFSFSTGGAIKTPFVLGETCVLYLAVTAATGTIGTMSLEFSAQENGAV